MMKALYKPLGVTVGSLGGVLAGALFKRTWKGLSGQSETPKPRGRHSP